jgi:hypothetical protein
MLRGQVEEVCRNVSSTLWLAFPFAGMVAVRGFRTQASRPGVGFLPFQLHNAVSFSSARATKRFPSSRCASTIQIVRPSRCRAESQPKLQPRFLRLSAMISQYFTPGFCLFFPSHSNTKNGIARKRRRKHDKACIRARFHKLACRHCISLRSGVGPGLHAPVCEYRKAPADRRQLSRPRRSARSAS